jgi:hypothetical protein
MDKYYLLTVIERLENEVKIHDQKFKDNPIHNNCLPRFEKTLFSLKEELVKIENLSLQLDSKVIRLP